MKKMSIQLVCLLSVFLFAACTGPREDYHSPWDFAQPSESRSQATDNGAVTSLEPQIDWRDHGNIRHDLERRKPRDARKSLEVIDVEVENQQPTRARSKTQSPVAAAPAKAARVKVALLVPMSGKHKELGNALLNAAQLALFDVGSENFELMPRDTKGTSNGAQTAIRSALDDGADLVLGPLLSDSVKSIKPVARSAGVPVVSFSTDWNVADRDTYIMGFLPFAQVARISNYAVSRGHGNVALLGPQGDYTRMVDHMLTNSLRNNGGRLIKKEIYPAPITDLSQLMAEFTEHERREATEYEENDLPYNAIMIPVGGQTVKTVSTFLGHYRVDEQQVRLLGTGLWDDPSLTKEPMLAGAWFAAPDPSLRRDFERSYRETYGERPPRLASLAYDGTALAAILAQNADGLSAKQVYDRSRLTSSRGFAGIDGVFRFRPDGLIERGLAVIEIRKDGPVVIDPAPRAFLSSKRS
ncbi:MAG: penicillin-binding protein activator [Pseudomonadota bacterium]